jgi:hypothetical protein
MSSGAFTLSKYEANDGTIYAVKIQPETLDLSLGSANAAPTGPIDGPVLAKVSKTKRAYGVGCRKVSFKFTAETPPAGYSKGQVLSLPVLKPTLWNTLKTGVTGTYLGGAVVVVGTSAESVR